MASRSSQRALRLVPLALLMACSQSTRSPTAGDPEAAPSKSSDSNFLFVWAGADPATSDSDFLAVIDAAPSSKTYGEILSTLEVGHAGGAHHTDHFMPSDGKLTANAFPSGRTYRFDLTDPAAPRLAGTFRNTSPYTFPHSFHRLHNGNTLATFQTKGEGNRTPGGIVELDPEGNQVRAGDADARAVDPHLRPYSLEVIPELDRVVSTTTDMRGNMNPANTASSIQFWRFSDLSRISTAVLPRGPRGNEHLAPAEPRVLADGRTVLVNTFFCGLYAVVDLETENPSAEHVASLPFEPGKFCALAVVIGDFWVQTVPAIDSLVVLDVSDPKQPSQVSTLRLGEDFRPHWLSASPDGRRLVTTGYGAMASRVVVLNFDPSSGSLELDQQFGGDDAGPGISFDRTSWPHGEGGPAIPHGAVFSAH